MPSQADVEKKRT